MPGGSLTEREEGDRALDDALARFDRFAADLVRLEPFPLDEVRQAVARFLDAVERHLRTYGPARRGPVGRQVPPQDRRPDLDLEHQRFGLAVDELRSYLAVVERDDHGGHRQALGQYGRLFTEALRVHRADERARSGPGGGARPRGADPGAAGQP